MKNFFSSFFASLSALLIFCLGGGLILLLVFAAFAAMGQKTVIVPKGAFLVLDLSANLQDEPNQMEGWDQFSEALDGSGARKLQLREVTRALQAAAADPDIAGLYLCGNLTPINYGSGFAALRELRDAIVAFKASGKPVKAYLTNATTRDYYVASAASEVTMDPYGAILMPGLASQPMFYTGLFEKLGVGVQVTRVGKYKSAVEPYIRKDMSPESREQTQKLLDDLWTEITGTIEQSRGLAPGTIQEAVDSEGVLEAAVAQKWKLVDRVAYFDTELAELKKATGVARTRQPFKQIAVTDYEKLVSGDNLVARRTEGRNIELGGAGKIAIVYAEGEIVDGTGNDVNFIYGDKLARELRNLRQDASVKAVVLRVNSPGGSASAAETIQREMRLILREKPVVVSMGTVAASGGYWISTFSDRIFAEPTTITGSIGVFGLFLNIQGLANDKLGLTFDTVKTGKFADLESIARPKTPDELAIFQRVVDWVYGQFIAKVATSRKLDRAAVQEMAQGRVWSGAEGKKLGLVDEIGGLDAAIKYAAAKAGLGDKFRVVEVPRQKLFTEVISEALEGRRHDFTRVGPVAGFLRQATAGLATLAHFNDPQGIYARLPLDQALP